MNGHFYKINEVTQHKYYQVPKELYSNPKYKTAINNDAKMLYALLLDRMELSRTNHWVDADGTIFLIFKREDLADMLGICVTTVWRAIKQLKEVGLLAEKRQGLNRPNLIYIGKIDYGKEQKEQPEKHDVSGDSPSIPVDSEKLNVKTVHSAMSGVLHRENQDIEKVKGNETENEKPELIDFENNDTERIKKVKEKNIAVENSS